MMSECVGGMCWAERAQNAAGDDVVIHHFSFSCKQAAISTGFITTIQFPDLCHVAQVKCLPKGHKPQTQGLGWQ